MMKQRAQYNKSQAEEYAKENLIVDPRFTEFKTIPNVTKLANHGNEIAKSHFKKG
jgi:hypothetical protein